MNDLAAPVIVLVEPQLGENIGAAARAMANFGLRAMRLVAPRDGWPNEAAQANAALAIKVVDDATVYTTLEEALADFHFVAATTARHRALNKPVASPEEAVSDIHARMAAGQRCCVLFGKERSGLENNQIALADLVVTAPVDPQFASLNLAQAVLLFSYEWRKLVIPEGLGRLQSRQTWKRGEIQALPAERHEFVGLLSHLEQELDACGFLFPPEKRETMVNNIRTMFLRMSPTSQEVRTLRGIIASLRRGPWKPTS